MDSSRVSVDLRTRTFEIEVPHDQVTVILDRLESFFAMPMPADEPAEDSRNASGPEDERSTDDVAGEQADADKLEPAKKRSKSPAKPRSYDHVDLGLSSEQRDKFRDDFAARAPVQQSDIVAVIGFQLKPLMGKGEFTPNEIYSAIKIINKPTPKNLLAVFGNMKRDGIADYTNGKVVINSLTDDHVNHHMKGKRKKA